MRKHDKDLCERLSEALVFSGELSSADSKRVTGWNPYSAINAAPFFDAGWMFGLPAKEGDVFDPMTGSGTCADVCREIGIPCLSRDIRNGFDATDAECFRSLPPSSTFDFVWAHPPYWRQKIYTSDLRDLSRTPTLSAFLESAPRIMRFAVHDVAEHSTSKQAFRIRPVNKSHHSFVTSVGWILV